MKRFILITGLLVALLGLIRSVEAIPIGYASNGAKQIRMINLSDGTFISSVFDSITYNFAFQGLAINSTASTLYGSDQNGNLHTIDIATGALTNTVAMKHNGVGIGTVEAMDFGGLFGTELWVTDFDGTDPTIYSINTSDGSATALEKFNLGGGSNGVVRAMTSNTTDSMWIANDHFPDMNFQLIDSIDKNIATTPGVTSKGFFDDANFFGPKIRGMDRIDGVLYGLAFDGGVYSINQVSGQLTKLGDTDGQADPMFDDVWLGLATSELSGPGSSTAPVAEPATILLLGIGVVGLAGGAIRRRIKNRRIEPQPSFV